MGPPLQFSETRKSLDCIAICFTETVKIALLLHDLFPLAAALISDVDQSNARHINLKEEG